MTLITVYVHQPAIPEAEAIEIAEELLVEELLQKLLGEQHTEFDLLTEGADKPHHRHHRLHEAGIKHGSHVHCRKKHREVTVHIDREPRQSPSHTTGAALYTLGNVEAGHQLYREIRGNDEDEPIFRDNETFDLQENEHFYSTDKVFKGFTIYVNTRVTVVHKRELSYDEVVALAGSYVKPTVTFEDAAGKRHDGTLAPGHNLKVKNGTIINVIPTNQS